MPKVLTKRKNRAGSDRTCGRCGNRIEPGQQYRQWSFRYGGTHYRCMKPECRPRRSELTMSKMGTVYDAIESAEEHLPDLTTYDDLDAEVHSVAETAMEVAQEYLEAAEPFGGEGENAERASELESWADQLFDFDGGNYDDLEEAREEAQELLNDCPL